MAELNNTIVKGSLRVTGEISVNNNTILKPLTFMPQGPNTSGIIQIVLMPKSYDSPSYAKFSGYLYFFYE